MTNLRHISLVLFFVIINRIQSIEHHGNCSCDALKARTYQIEEMESITCRNMSIFNSDIDPDLLCQNPTLKRIELQGNFIQSLHLNSGISLFLWNLMLTYCLNLIVYQRLFVQESESKI